MEFCDHGLADFWKFLKKFLEISWIFLAIFVKMSISELIDVDLNTNPRAKNDILKPKEEVRPAFTILVFWGEYSKMKLKIKQNNI